MITSGEARNLMPKSPFKKILGEIDTTINEASRNGYGGISIFLYYSVENTVFGMALRDYYYSKNKWFNKDKYRTGKAEMFCSFLHNFISYGYDTKVHMVGDVGDRSFIIDIIWKPGYPLYRMTK